MKKAIAVFAAAVMVLSLAACGNEGNVESENSGTSTTTTGEKENSADGNGANAEETAEAAESDVEYFEPQRRILSTTMTKTSVGK